MDFDDDFFDADAFDDGGAIGDDFFFSASLNEDGAGDETKETISPRAIRRRARQRMIRQRQKQSLRDIIKAPPEPGETIHVVSASKFNFYTWTPVLVDFLGVADEFYCATWSVNLQSVNSLLEEIDAGRIKRAAFAVGLYLKRREPVVYTKLAEGLTRRGVGWVKSLETHAKVLLLANEARGDFLTIEGSANLTDNPRVEQYALTNDRPLYEFHKEWFEEVRRLRKKLPWL